MRSGQLGKPGHGMGREIYKFSYRRLHPWDLRLMGRCELTYSARRSGTARNGAAAPGITFCVPLTDPQIENLRNNRADFQERRTDTRCTMPMKNLSVRRPLWSSTQKFRGCILLLASSGGRPSIACHTALYGLISSYGLRTARMHSAAAAAAGSRPEKVREKGGEHIRWRTAHVESNYNVDVTRQSNRGGDERTTNPSGSLIVKVSTTQPCRYRSVDIGPANNERE
ncbi:hypothetical protein ALC57_17127 [Trachymyrmex cornetzi]|uniref:Uncharacterized protein n=1 Tax=Trachymyrmex cornetzi TaxID=471704 RepID=A0A195DCF9_9HYME|nr:hypothetical protein ALC57_17127 [Trachymyrmex cornetzi]